MADQLKPLLVMTCTPGAGHVNPITTIAKVSPGQHKLWLYLSY